MAWTQVPIDQPTIENVDEAALRTVNAALENGYVTETGTVSRFPGLRLFCQLPGGRVVLDDWRSDMVAITSAGKMFAIDEAGTARDVTSFPISGGGRPTIAKTENDMMIAAGGPIVRWSGAQTERLSRLAPDSTHICFIAGRLVAIEPRSGRFQHTAVGEYDSWDPLDTFSAEGDPDNIVAAVTTPFRELLMAGPESIEQFEAVSSSEQPFFRRAVNALGILAPYTLLPLDVGTFGVSNEREFVRFNTSVGSPVSDPVQAQLEAIDTWDDAWAQRIIIRGQKFIILQAPLAANAYGTQGVTLLYDYRKRRWSALYGFDPVAGTPVRWPGWSVKSLWGRVFVGGDDGAIYEATADTYWHADAPVQMLGRSGHMDQAGAPLRVDNVRVRIKRGVATGDRAPELWVRINRDNKGFGRWKHKDLGLAGDRHMVLTFGPMGACDTFQLEWRVTGDCPVELVRIEADVTRLGV